MTVTRLNSSYNSANLDRAGLYSGAHSTTTFLFSAFHKNTAPTAGPIHRATSTTDICLCFDFFDNTSISSNTYYERFIEIRTHWDESGVLLLLKNPGVSIDFIQSSLLVSGHPADPQVLNCLCRPEKVCLSHIRFHLTWLASLRRRAMPHF
jgi:hypothetical protein